MIEINYILIVVLGFVAMAVGAVWYGPLFGKQWMRLQGISESSAHMGPRYVVQFVATLVMIFVVYVFTKPAADVMHEVSSALWLWAGIVVPVLISATIWTNRTRREMIALLLIQSGYVLTLFVIIGYAVHVWG